jgi:hypothetical protein
MYFSEAALKYMKDGYQAVEGKLNHFVEQTTT